MCDELCEKFYDSVEAHASSTISSSHYSRNRCFCLKTENLLVCHCKQDELNVCICRYLWSLISEIVSDCKKLIEVNFSIFAGNLFGRSLKKYTYKEKVNSYYKGNDKMKDLTSKLNIMKIDGSDVDDYYTADSEPETAAVSKK